MPWLMLHDCIPFVFELVYLGLYLDYAYPYLHLYIRGTLHLFVIILSGEPKELITMMKAQGYSGEKASVMNPLIYIGLYRHVIISFMTF